MADSDIPRMVDAGEGCSKDTDTQSDDDDWEETMEALNSGTVPQSMDGCLALNLVYQELVQHFMRNVESCLAQNREKQRSLEQELQGCSSDVGKKQTVKIPVHLYLPPYFRDSAGMAPFPNEDAKAKANELNILVEPPKKWTKDEKKILLKAVKSTIIDMELAPLLEKRDIALARAKQSSDPKELDEFTDEIRRLEKQIESVKNKTDLLTVPPEMFEKIDWISLCISYFGSTRTTSECKLLWHNELDPRLNQSAIWSSEELTKLKQVAEARNCRNWPEIAKDLGTGRTAFQCFEKYQTELNPNMGIRPWTQEEDSRLREAVQNCRFGEYIPWEQVADMMEGRTRLQCMQHWRNVLAPGIKRGRWTEEEDLLLLHAVEKCGPKDWRKVALLVPGRSHIQCRERWAMSIASGQRMGTWTIEEDALLFEGVKHFGIGAWTKIHHFIRGRSAGACKIRFRTLHKQVIKSSGRCDSSQGTYPKQAMILNRKKAQQYAERQQRLTDQFTRAVGHAPVMSTIANDIEKALESLPEGVRQALQTKIEAIRTNGVTSRPNFALPIIARRRFTKGAKRLRLDENDGFNEHFMALFEKQEGVPRGTRPSFKPVRMMANFVLMRKVQLPPTSATLGALRKLLTWHGADTLVGDRVMNSSVTKTTENEEAIHFQENEEAIHFQNNADVILTRKAAAPMRSYLEDRDAQPTTSYAGTSNNAGERADDDIPPDLLPDDAAVRENFTQLRELFGQLFLWPALLAMLPESNDDLND